MSAHRTDTHRSADLPPPSPEERTRSGELTALIRQEIETSGDAIDFARFMELALYAPGLGYYSGGLRKFGAGGDFVTAPELGSVFARLLARQCAEILAPLGTADILEAGAGSGALAAATLAELEVSGRLPREYLILELSTELRARQRDALTACVPHLAPRVRWLDQPPERFRGVVVANELLDAVPVERFRAGAEGVKQQQVGWQEDKFVWRERIADAPLRTRVESLKLADGYVSEIGLQAEAWVRSMAERIEQGVLLLIDYGFPRAEFYHPQRHTGTLMCHYRQRAHGDPLVLAGLQDITAHVDFTAIAEAGVESGLDVLGYTSQAMFLIGCGLEELVAASDPADTATHLRLTNEIQKLTSPAEMGELFKVMALGRGVHIPLRGFALQDRRTRL